MDVLVVSWSFPPTEGPRAIKAEAIVAELLRLGHRVTLITRQGSGDLREDISGKLHALILMPREEWPTLRFDLRKSEKEFSTSWLARNINGMLYRFLCYPGIEAFFRTSRAMRAVRGQVFDLTISVDGPQPLHWAVAQARRKGVSELGAWIADCGDPLLRKLEGNKPTAYFRFVENAFLRAADVITVPVPQGTEYFEPQFLPKIHTVPHSLQFPSKDTMKPVRLELSQPGRAKFAYAGNLSPYRKQLFDFCKVLSTEGEFQFHIFGPNEIVVDALLKEFPNLRDKLIFHGVSNRHELLNLLRSFDFLVLFTYQSGFQVPFKIIDYSFASRPILHFESTREGEQRLFEFLNGDYKSAFPAADYEMYDSRNTVKQYLELAGRKVP